MYWNNRPSGDIIEKSEIIMQNDLYISQWIIQLQWETMINQMVNAM